MRAKNETEGLILCKLCRKAWGLRALQRSWCLKCYSLEGACDYPIKGIDEGDGFALDGIEKNRFLSAWQGDNYTKIFQCEYFHFQNIKKRDSLPGTFNLKMLEYIYVG